MPAASPSKASACIQVRSDEAQEGPPTKSLLAESRPSLPSVLSERFQLGVVQSGIHFRWMPRIHVVQAFRDRISRLLFQELRNRRSVQVTSRNAEATGNSVRLTE